jgi:molecular chaperone HscB
MICWNCHENGSGAGPLCSACGALQPPPAGIDHFSALGLPRRYGLDLQELESRYRELSRVVHPDRHVRADAAERRASLLWSTEINEGYRVLRDPSRRAEYLLELRGIKVADEGSGAKHGDAAFLMEMMNLREELGEARAAGDRARVESLAGQVQKERGRCQEQIAAEFAALEANQGHDGEGLGRLTRWLVTQRYYGRFLEDVSDIEGLWDGTPSDQ